MSREESEKIATVLLVEDDPATRERLAASIDAHPALGLLTAVGSLAEARAALADGAPDVLLVDLGLPDGDGTELIREIRGRHEPTEAMVVTVFGDEKHVVAAIEAGATGYLLKDTRSEEIGSAILDLLAGGSPISPSIARHLLRRFRDVPDLPEEEIPRLTEREREVLVHLVKGFTFGEIGRLLEISAHTVTSHVKHIYRKLEVRSRAEAVYEALQLGIVSKDV